jgi:hypothetical protein
MKKPKHLNNHTQHTAQLTIPAPPPGPPIDPDVATDFTLPPPVPPISNGRPTLGLWGKERLLKSTPLQVTDVVEDFTNAKAPTPQVRLILNFSIHSVIDATASIR